MQQQFLDEAPCQSWASCSLAGLSASEDCIFVKLKVCAKNCRGSADRSRKREGKSSKNEAVKTLLGLGWKSVKAVVLYLPLFQDLGCVRGTAKARWSKLGSKQSQGEISVSVCWHDRTLKTLHNNDKPSVSSSKP